MPFDLPIYTLVHVAISLLGIFAGLVVVGGLAAGVLLQRWTGIFLASTWLTTISGFGFPFETLLPSHIVGVLSLLVLPFAMVALYAKHLARGWRQVFVICSTLSLYLNAFVLLAQLFQKIPILAALAPTPQAPAFAITQLLLLLLFGALGYAAARGFRSPSLPAASACA